MPSKKKHFIFTDCDLDGAGSYLMWPWFMSSRPEYMTVRVNDFAARYKSWVASGNLNKYDRVFILDLDISRVDCFDLVDNDKVTIIDHHQTHVENVDKYKHATVHVKQDTSCTKMVYNLFRKGGKELTAQQKTLIAMIDDYDSYKLKLPQSYHLNILFWNYQGDRLAKFLEDYSVGFQGFSSQQQNIINFYSKKLQNIKNDLSVHWAIIPIKSKGVYKFISVFADECVNEVADHVIKNYKADVGMVINLKSNKVSIRKSSDCDLKLGSFADKLFDEGGGHDDAAGGKICEKFLQFSSLFKEMGVKIGS